MATVRVKEFYLNNEGKATEVLWDNGLKEKIPFHVDYSLQDYGDDESAREAYWGYMNTLVSQYGAIASKLRPQEPHFMHYEGGSDDPRYQSDLRLWEGAMVGDAVARANRPPQPPPVYDWDFLAATASPHKVDRELAKQRIADKTMIQRLRADAQRAELAGNLDKARELNSMANAQERIQERGAESKYTFQKEYDEHLASDAETRLKAVEGQWISGNPTEARGLCTSWNHEASEEHSYRVRVSPDGQSYMVVSLAHAGVTARNLNQSASGEDNLDHLMRLSYPAEGEEGKEKGEAEKGPDDPWGSQKAFEEWRTSGKMPEEKPEETSPSGQEFQASLKPL